MFRGFKNDPQQANHPCPICISRCDAREIRGLPSTSSDWIYTCPKCGIFALDYFASAFLNNIWEGGFEFASRKKLYKISFAVRTAAEAFSIQQESFQPPILTPDKLQSMMDLAEPSVQEKMELTLRHIAKQTKYPGQYLTIDFTFDYSVVCGRNEEEFRFYCSSLLEQGLIEDFPSIGRLTQHTSSGNCKITAKGWQELNRLEQSGEESSNAFIAISFHPDRNPFSIAISEAVRAAGYTPIRIDQVEHINRIDDEILARIRSSKFLVSDFTGQRNGVYFEAGFMLGLGRPVIWVCEKDDLKNVHFDTRQYNTIDYTDADDLKTRLQFRIEAILGKGPIKPQ